MRTSIAILSLLLSSFIGYSQSGSISGIVTDAEDNEAPLMRAKIVVLGSGKGGYSKYDGTYNISGIAPGTYKVKIAYVMKAYNKTIDSVKVTAGADTKLDVALGAVAERLQTVELDLSDFVDEKSEEAAIDEVKEETKVTEVASQQEIAKKGDSKVSDAVKRISGVSLEDGKYANIRGLNDRFIKTMLNGSEIPTLDPSRNAVQLDLFPTTFLSSIKVVKTFSPDLPGDFTGGLIDIRTAEYPDSFYVKVNVGSSYNTLSSFNGNFQTFEGKSLDNLGLSSSDRDIPSLFFDENGERNVIDVAQTFRSESNAQLADEQINSLDRFQGPTTMTTPVNFNFAATFGNKIEWTNKKDTNFTRSFGYFGGASYRKSFSYYDLEDGESNRYKASSNLEILEDGFLNPRMTRSRSKSSFEVLANGLLGLWYMPNKRNKINLNIIRNQSANKSYAIADGLIQEDAPNQFIRSQQFSFIQRGMTTAQAIGKHDFDSTIIMNAPMTIDWISTVTSSNQDQPDFRQVEDAYELDVNGERVYDFRVDIHFPPSRFWRYMEELNTDNKIHFTWKFNRNDSTQFKIKTGLSHTYKQREFEESRVDYRDALGNVQFNGNIDELFADNNIGIIGRNDNNRAVFAFGLDETTVPKNRYSAFQHVAGTYLMTEYPISPKLDIVTGARLEYTIIDVESGDPSIPRAEVNQMDVLPSLNFIYKLVDDRKVTDRFDTNQINNQSMKLRLSYNRTLARPTFREIAPFSNDDFIERIRVTGNPEIERFLIDNFDLRWEYYPRTGELISVAAFYKRIDNIITFLEDVRTANEFTWENVPGATSTYGLEFEIRKNLRALGERMKNFRFGINATIAQSSSPIPDEQLEQIRRIDASRGNRRPMPGQSPYLVNAIFEYDNDSIGLSSNVTMNVFGRRVFIYVADGSPDVYEMPRPRLDWNIKKSFNDGRYSLTLRLQNLLDPDFVQQYIYDGNDSIYEAFNDQEYVFDRYRRGRSVSLSFSYTF